VRLAIRLDTGTWTNARLQRRAYIRRRFYAVAVVCLLLTSCPVWVSPMYEFVGMYYEGGEWVVTWRTWGEDRHVRTPDYASAAMIDAILWGKGRVTAW
jgi:hypothetical protein